MEHVGFDILEYMGSLSATPNMVTGDFG